MERGPEFPILSEPDSNPHVNYAVTLGRKRVFATVALVGALFGAGSVLDAAPVCARDERPRAITSARTSTRAPELSRDAAAFKSNPGAKSAAAQARAARLEQKKAERAAKREERSAAKKAAKKSHDGHDGEIASTKGSKAAKGSGKQAIDDPRLTGGSSDNDPLEGL